MSTLSHTVRPFAGLEPLQQILAANARLLVGIDRVEDGDTILLDSDAFGLRPIAVELGVTDELWEFVKVGLRTQVHELGFDLTDLELVAVATSPYMKIAEVLLRASLADIGDHQRVFPLSDRTPRPRAFSTPRSGCTVDVYLVLARQVERRPLRPWRKGTWLARTSYSITTELAPVGFTPRALTDEVRAEFGVPSETVRFVTFDGDESPLDPESSEDAVLMFVDPEILAKLAAGTNKLASELFQHQLFLDAVTVVLERARSTERFESLVLSDLDGTLFGRMIDGFSRRQKQTPEERRAEAENLLSLAREKPHVFLSSVEHVIGTRKILNEVLDQ